MESKPDVFGQPLPPVPELHHTRFNPLIQDKASSRPGAYRFFEELVATRPTDALNDLLDQINTCRDLLIWGHAPGYTTENVGQVFLDSYCHALLTGPDGPLHCAAPLGAFVLFGPNTLYRDHRHSPNEIYLALTGGGEWRLGEQDWRYLEAGQTIFIPSNTVHAIRSGSEPLLTFSFWLEPGDMGEIEI